MELLTRKKFRSNYIISIISKYSFAIYMLHICFKHIFLSYFSMLSIHRSINVFLLWICTFVMGLVGAIFLDFIPGFGKTLLYLKKSR